MKKILDLIVIFLILSCSKGQNENYCKQIELQKNFKNYEKDLTVDLKYFENEKILQLSILNKKHDTIIFPLPKLFFNLRKSNTVVRDSNIVIKEYIPSVFFSKSVSYIEKLSVRRIISIDSTMQRNEDKLLVKIGPREKFAKEFYMDCRQSDKGNYMLYFLSKANQKKYKINQINYPQNAMLIIR
ncbi:hypothetical protein [Chryseobacterium sp.]|uniref:hypothetical protein n=1 Tax=Chryseobacterium sp. TaxID=1871047 RepID=UPI000ED3767E|nr:hypothetical protein [Chryseobacterium sp.]HCA07388.1 hypothetical protein [Chryseobacterium sp.]